MTATQYKRGAQRREERNARDLERDSDAIRADMDRTLEALERKFSPREVVERSVSYVREHGSELAHEVGETVRRNPVPVVLTVAGLAWLTAAIARDRSEQAAQDWADEDDDLDDDQLESGYAATETESGDGRIRSAARRARTAARNAAHRVSDTLQSRTSQARNSFGRFVQDEPLVVGMIALTAGALLGASLPVTEYERRALDGSSGNGSKRDRGLSDDNVASVGSDATPPI